MHIAVQDSCLPGELDCLFLLSLLQVFVPDAPKAPRSVWGDDVLPPAASTVTTPTYPDAPAGSSLANGGEQRRAVVPEWWAPNTAVYCTPTRKEDLQKEVRRASMGC